MIAPQQRQGGRTGLNGSCRPLTKLSFGHGSCMLVDVLLEQPLRELKMVRLRDCPRHSGLLGASGGIATGLSVCWPDGQPPVLGV